MVRIILVWYSCVYDFYRDVKKRDLKKEITINEKTVVNDFVLYFCDM